MDQGQTSTVGYKVDLDYRRRGYARETLGTLIPEIEKEYRIKYIRAEVLTTNVPSQNLLTGLGFRRTAMLPGGAHLNGMDLDEYLYIKED